MRAKRSEAGMTLIEVLIAVVLFSMLSVGILEALRVGLNAMERADDRLMQNRRAAYAERILRAELNGFMPEIAVFRPAPQSQVQSMRFFQGEPDTVRLVSTYSLQDASRGMPKILEFHVVPGEANRGVRLIVNEHPYTGPMSAGAFCLGYSMPDPTSPIRVPLFRPVETGPQSFVLADKLAYCRFAFLWPRVPPAAPVWVDHWVQYQWPMAVRFEMAPLDPDPSKLQPTTVTTTFHVNKDTGFEYLDN
jgi:prepilin-type N-terminal cleavage/methylation domain-containing protein